MISRLSTLLCPLSLSLSGLYLSDCPCLFTSCRCWNKLALEREGDSREQRWRRQLLNTSLSLSSPQPRKGEKKRLSGLHFLTEERREKGKSGGGGVGGTCFRGNKAIMYTESKRGRGGAKASSNYSVTIRRSGSDLLTT